MSKKRKENIKARVRLESPVGVTKYDFQNCEVVPQEDDKENEITLIINPNQHIKLIVNFTKQ